MKVAFQADVLRDEMAWHHLDGIVHRIEEGAHEWEIDDPDTIEESNWLCESRRNIREVYQKATVRSSYPSSCGLHARRVTVSSQREEGHLAPIQALAYISGPLFVLCENKFSDGLLLSTLLTVLAPAPLQKL